MRYPAREYEDVSPRSKPARGQPSTHSSWQWGVYTRKFKRPFWANRHSQQKNLPNHFWPRRFVPKPPSALLIYLLRDRMLCLSPN